MQLRQDPLVRKLGSFLRLSRDELQCLAELQSAPRSVAQQTDLVREGQTGHRAFILQEGWACSYKLLPDGGRQIITFLLPGDFMGLRSVLLRTADHSFATYTDSLVSEVPARRMMRIFQDLPKLGAAILWAASRDEAIAVEHLVNIGKRSAIQRMAHFFLELGERLQLVGLASSAGFECPLNQYVVADALGLSAIHVNRVLRELRERRLMTVKGHRVTIHAPAPLRKLAAYDSGYLDQDREPQ